MESLIDKMRDYSNHVIMEALILDFRAKLKRYSENPGERSSEGIEAGFWLKEFDEQFGIVTATHGKIE